MTKAECKMLGIFLLLYYACMWNQAHTKYCTILLHKFVSLFHTFVIQDSFFILFQKLPNNLVHTNNIGNTHITHHEIRLGGDRS